MLQRIQTVWLFLAALLAATLFADWYTGYLYQADIPSGLVGSQVFIWRVTNNFATTILAGVMLLIPLIAIFLFKNRKLQRQLVLSAVAGAVVFIAVNLYTISQLVNTHTPAPVPGSGTYMPGSVLPAVIIVLLILAISGIRADDKLVRSADRFR